MSYNHEGKMNWISWTLRMQLLFSIFTHSEMIGQMEELSIEILTTGRIPCIHNISPELIDFVGWTKSTRRDYYENGNEYLVTWVGDRIVQDHQDYSIDTDFSLVIHDVTAMSMGIYRCTVVPKDATDVSNSDARLTVYKNPEPPSITYEILGDDNIKIDCTHGPVFPLLYPNFPFPFQNNRTILNDDGTYMVSISAVQQFSDSEIILYCSHSYPGQHRSSFLTVHRSIEYNNPCSHTNPPRGISPQSSGPNTERSEGHSCDAALVGLMVCLMILMSLYVAASGFLYCHRDIYFNGISVNMEDLFELERIRSHSFELKPSWKSLMYYQDGQAEKLRPGSLVIS